MSEQKVPRSVEQRIVIKFLVGENVPSAEKFITDSNNSMGKSVSYGDTLPHTVVGAYCCWSISIAPLSVNIDAIWNWAANVVGLFATGK